MLFEISFVNDVCALSLAPLDGVRCLQLYLRTDAQHALELRGKPLLEFVDGCGRVEYAGEVFLADLYLYPWMRLILTAVRPQLHCPPMREQRSLVR